MMKPNSAKVHWDEHKKHWTVEIQFGSEVLKRPIPDAAHPAPPEELKSKAVEIGRDEGYDVDPAQIVVQM
ncbi:MAG TPA: hypothetical protein VKE70_09395 [Candidatus Solibacter sp.]|nr:hypothetical protein [Candidatus Solibacter sp.]